MEDENEDKTSGCGRSQNSVHIRLPAHLIGENGRDDQSGRCIRPEQPNTSFSTLKSRSVKRILLYSILQVRFCFRFFSSRSSTANFALVCGSTPHRSRRSNGAPTATRNTGAGRCPSFGDPRASVLILGLAPGAHGSNRTGRMFTGDRSGDILYRVLHRTGFASQGTAVSRDDGLKLRDLYITAAAHCAPPGNKPLPAELRNCRPWLERELALLTEVEGGGRARQNRLRRLPGRAAARGASSPAVPASSSGTTGNSRPRRDNPDWSVPTTRASRTHRPANSPRRC